MELNRAESLDEFEAAVDRMGEMNYSFVAADREGIAYRVGVEIPDRPDVTGARGPWRAMDGSDAGSLWTDLRLGPERLPRSRATERGWLGTANNDPFGFTADGNIEDDPWYYGSFFAPGYRAQRIHSELERLTARGELNLEDMKALQTDIHSTLADDLLPLLQDAWERRGSDPLLAEFAGSADLEALVGLLGRWDRRMARESAGALAFQAYLHHVTEAVLADDIPLAYDFAIELNPVFLMKIAVLALQGVYGDNAVLEDPAALVLLASGARTAGWLRGRFGAITEDAFAWSDLKVTRFDHALGFGIDLFDLPSDGGEDTLNVSQNISFGEDAETWATTWVSVERSIARFDDEGRPELWVSYPLAARAEPQADSALMEDYLEGRYRRMLTDRADIEAVAVERIKIVRERR
jgi:penicillin amidase